MSINKPSFTPTTVTGIFTRYIAKTIPLAFDEAMSYYECLCALLEYLNKTIVPDVNNLNTGLSELYSYVEHYFDNLDIQEEVNEKLDEMASSGELAELISQYLESQAIIGFNNCSDLAEAENLADGSLVKTYGQNNYYDTKGAFYKVRTRLNSDDPDGYNLIELTNTDNLVAQKVGLSDYQIQQSIDQTNSLERNAIYLGNSYTNGYGSVGNSNGLFNLTKDMFDHAYKFTGSGTGFLGYTGHTTDTFELHLDDAIASSSFENSSITDIIIVGAWGETNEFNEYGSDSFSSQIRSAASSFMTKVKTNFPNIKHVSYIMAESRNIHNSTGSVGTNYYSTMWYVHNYLNIILPEVGMEYKGWIGFNILMSNSDFYTDKVHPNDNGYAKLASYFKAAFNGGFEYKTYTESFSNLACSLTEDSLINGRIDLTEKDCTITISNMTLKTGSVSFNVNYELADFSSLNRMPPITMNTKDLGAFTLPANTTNSSSFNPGTNIIGKLSYKPNSDMTGAILELKSFGSRSVASQINNTTQIPSQFYINFKQVTSWARPE